MSRRTLLYRKKLLQLGHIKCPGGAGRNCGGKGCSFAHRENNLPKDVMGALATVSRRDKYAMANYKMVRLAARFKS